MAAHPCCGSCIVSVAWLDSMFVHTRVRRCGAVRFSHVHRVFNLAALDDCFGAMLVADFVRRFVGTIISLDVEVDLSSCVAFRPVSSLPAFFCIRVVAWPLALVTRCVYLLL